MTQPLDTSRVSVRKRRLRYTGRTFSLVTETVSFDGSATADLDIIRHPGAVVTVPMIDNRSVLLIKQYRHAVGGLIWELPAGTLEAGEAPLAAARRELIEETGYASDQWESLGALTPVPGYSDEQQHLFVARALTPAVQNLDPDEHLTVHIMELSAALAMIDDGRIHDGKTVAALLRLDRRRRPAIET